MDNMNLLNKAKNLKYSFLFHSKEETDSFFNNLDSNVIINEDDKVVLFVERQFGVNSLYWAGESIKEVAESLKKLKNKFKFGEVIQVSCVQEKESLASIEEVSKEFINAGCEAKFHEIGYTTSNLEGDKEEYNGAEVAKTEDVNEIYRILDDCLGANKVKLDKDEIRKFIKADDRNVFVTREDCNITGVIFVSIFDNMAKNAKRLFIRSLAVDEKYRGNGYSKQLLCKGFKWAEKLEAVDSMLWVEKNNETAIRLYEKFGYSPYGDEEMMLEYTI